MNSSCRRGVLGELGVGWGVEGRVQVVTAIPLPPSWLGCLPHYPFV